MYDQTEFNKAMVEAHNALLHAQATVSEPLVAEVLATIVLLSRLVINRLMLTGLEKL